MIKYKYFRMIEYLRRESDATTENQGKNEGVSRNFK